MNDHLTWAEILPYKDFTKEMWKKKKTYLAHF